MSNCLSTKPIIPEVPVEKNYLDELKDILDLQLHDHQERDIIRVLIEHGTKNIEGYKNVAHFILHEIQEHEIEIDHPIITNIINEISTQLENDNLNIQDFVNHKNPHITTFIATILS